MFVSAAGNRQKKWFTGGRHINREIEKSIGDMRMGMHNITIRLPEEVKQIIAVIEAHGGQAYAVGGCVRDSILGREPDDWDITTSVLPEELKSYFKKTVDTGIKHGTVTVLLNGQGYEVTTYRIDGEYKDGRHPESVAFSASLSDDLKRRDFTINAMAYNDRDGLVDRFDGIGDLKRGIIRCVGDAQARFTEDALRMMRAIRFSAQLGFEIEPSTYEAVIKLAPDLSKVSMERIQAELVKTLISDHPERVVLYQKTGLFETVLPAIYSVLSGKYARNALEMLKNTKKTAVLRYAALLNTVQPDEVRATLRSLKLDNYTVEHVTKLVACAKDTVEENEPAVREAIHKYGREQMLLMFEHECAVIAAKEEITGISMTGRRKHLMVIERMYHDILERGDCISVKDLDITGNDLMEYGLSGPQIGRTLDGLLRIVIENPKLNDKATLIALIEHLE